MLRRKAADARDLAAIQQLFKLRPGPLASDQKVLRKWHFVLVVAAHTLVAIELQPEPQLALGVEDRHLPAIGIERLQALRHRSRRIEVVYRRAIDAQQYSH